MTCRSRSLSTIGGCSSSPALVCAGLGPAFVLGADVTVAAVIGALVLVFACPSPPPAPGGLAAAALAAGAGCQRACSSWWRSPTRTASTTLVSELVGQGDGWADLLRLAGVSAVAANRSTTCPPTWRSSHRRWTRPPASPPSWWA